MCSEIHAAINPKTNGGEEEKKQKQKKKAM